MATEPTTSDRIYLQLFEQSDGGHTWCDERINDNDVEYIRADLIQKVVASLQELEAACEQIAGARTREQYLSLIDDGQQPLLERLDDARRVAKAVLKEST